MIIDAHTHISEKGTAGPFGLACSAQDLVCEMDKHNIERSLVIPSPGMASNKFVKDQCKVFPDRLVPLYMPDFGDSSFSLREMDRFVQENGCCGLKVHPRVQNVTITDPFVEEVLLWAAEHAAPVVFDVFPFGPGFAEPLHHPGAYCRLAQRMPKLQIILAHAGGYKVMEAFLAAKACPNIFLDISFTPWYFRETSVAKDLKFICQRLPAGKVLYGSDFPDAAMGEMLDQANWLATGLDAERRTAFFGGAAARIFKSGTSR